MAIARMVTSMFVGVPMSYLKPKSKAQDFISLNEKAANKHLPSPLPFNNRSLSSGSSSSSSSSSSSKGLKSVN